MSRLLVKATTPDSSGRTVTVTPQSAGWPYVGFECFRLAPGQSVSRQTADMEYCVVVVAGTCRAHTSKDDFGDLVSRESPFERSPPAAIYVPAKDSFTVTAIENCEIALCSAPGSAAYPARRIAPKKMSQETRGEGSNIRHVCNILPESEPAESLLVVEVLTPGGNWSSYPPHKHDKLDLPHESELVETYYHRLNPEQGFAFQRVYTDDRSLDETMAVGNGDVVMVPRGYHPVGAPHGYDLYYLNVMAGPKRVWKFRDDPNHAWLAK